ncbi:MAG: hypothetical protein P1S46_11755 [bacterium]|nr:hypothetical protein [bacterium]
MAKLNVNKTTEAAEVLINGDPAVFTLRKPSIEEMQNYLNSQVVVTGRKMHDQTLRARCNFFDELLVEISDLEDEDGVAITTDRKDVIPPKIKARVVQQLFEENDFTVIKKN